MVLTLVRTIHDIFNFSGKQSWVMQYVVLNPCEDNTLTSSFLSSSHKDHVPTVPRPQKYWFFVSKSVLDVSTFSKFKGVSCQTVRPQVPSMIWKSSKMYPVISKLSPIYEQKCSRPMKFFESVPSNFKSVPDPWSFSKVSPVISKVSPAHESFQKCPQ